MKTKTNESAGSFAASGTSSASLIGAALDELTLEAVTLGDASDAAHSADSAAIATRNAKPDIAIFSRKLLPSTPAAIAMYSRLVDRIPHTNYGADLAAIAARALVSDPDLFALLCGVEALEDIGIAAAVTAAPAPLETHRAAGDRAAAAAIARYKLLIAGILAAADGHELQAAGRELLACEALRERLAAAKARHEDHARAELARAQAERRAVARAVIDKTVERVRAAEAEAADALAKATQSAHAYRQLRAEAFAERLRLSGLKDLRLGRGDGVRGVFGVDDLIATAGEMSIEQLAMFEAALHEAGR